MRRAVQVRGLLDALNVSPAWRAANALWTHQALGRSDLKRG